MDENLLEKWEYSLKQEGNIKYFKNRNKFGKRFGKKNLIDLFQNGKNFLESTENTFNDKFKMSFASRVLNPLKKEKNYDFVKIKTYSSLMSLFSKFIYFLRKHETAQYDNLIQVPKKATIIQQETKELLLDNIQEYHIPKNEQIRPDEKDLFSMDEDGDVLPPTNEENFVFDHNKKNNKEDRNQQLKLDL